VFLGSGIFDLSVKGIGDVGYARLAGALECLRLDFVNGIGEVRCVAVAGALHGVPRLTRLDLVTMASARWDVWLRLWLGRCMW